MTRSSGSSSLGRGCAAPARPVGASRVRSRSVSRARLRFLGRRDRSLRLDRGRRIRIELRPAREHELGSRERDEPWRRSRVEGRRIERALDGLSAQRILDAHEHPNVLAHDRHLGDARTAVDRRKVAPSSAEKIRSTSVVLRCGHDSRARLTGRHGAGSRRRPSRGARPPNPAPPCRACAQAS